MTCTKQLGGDRGPDCVLNCSVLPCPMLLTQTTLTCGLATAPCNPFAPDVNGHGEQASAVSGMAGKQRDTASVSLSELTFAGVSLQAMDKAMAVARVVLADEGRGRLLRLSIL